MAVQPGDCDVGGQLVNVDASRDGPADCGPLTLTGRIPKTTNSTRPVTRRWEPAGSA